jgi:hypothetical protein
MPAEWDATTAHPAPAVNDRPPRTNPPRGVPPFPPGGRILQRRPEPRAAPGVRTPGQDPPAGPLLSRPPPTGPRTNVRDAPRASADQPGEHAMTTTTPLPRRLALAAALLLPLALAAACAEEEKGPMERMGERADEIMDDVGDTIDEAD